jgi:hypothetical protein
MDEFQIDQLTKELVRAQLSKLDDPCAVTASLVKQTLSVALYGAKNGEDGPDKLIADACRGGITGLLLSKHDVAKGSVLILGAVSELAAELELDPVSALSSALWGLSDLARFLEPEALSDVQQKLAFSCVGAGEYFAECVKQVLAAQPSEKAAVLSIETGETAGT